MTVLWYRDDENYVRVIEDLVRINSGKSSTIISLRAFESAVLEYLRSAKVTPLLPNIDFLQNVSRVLRGDLRTQARGAMEQCKSFSDEPEPESATDKYLRVCAETDDPQKLEGLKTKYKVSRTDGKQIDNCVVLEFKDGIARAGIRAWSHAMRERGYTKVADDVDDLLESTEEPCK